MFRWIINNNKYTWPCLGFFRHSWCSYLLRHLDKKHLVLEVNLQKNVYMVNWPVCRNLSSLHYYRSCLPICPLYSLHLSINPLFLLEMECLWSRTMTALDLDFNSLGTLSQQYRLLTPPSMISTEWQHSVSQSSHLRLGAYRGQGS